ncbi:MAG: prolipoprotein diacylglyceryl transferase [Anaerolineae bacterium]|nr:prolipoprotein diacylglyceryl transferase [Anaerolineae bacterium]
MDPVIFSFNIGNITFALRWYGVFVMFGILASAWLTTREIKRRGEDPEWIWDMLLWLVIGGVIGARLWYVLNAILGGNRYYLENPLQIINIPQGGLHYYGAMIGGAIALIIYTRIRKLDVWLFIDSVAPSLLIGQALARPANFINQELYGQPTTLPWGIPIDAAHRLPIYSNMTLFPDSTRFHPTFAYEMLWNFITGGLLLWAMHKFSKKVKPGAVFAAWLVLAGIGRTIIETWRPDQPVIPGTLLSYSRLVAILMAVAGAVWLMYLYKVIRPRFMKAPREKYVISKGYPVPGKK